MKVLLLISGLLASVVLTPGEVLRTNVSSFEIPMMGMSRSLDINNDGVVDFIVRSESPLATFNVPSSGSASGFRFDAAGTNQFLVSDYAFVQPAKSLISSNSPTGANWSHPGASALLTSRWIRKNGDTTSTGWNGSLGDLKEGFLGVRFYATDGLHYGWVFVRLPKSGDDPWAPMSPIIVSWAFETVANIFVTAKEPEKK